MCRAHVPRRLLGRFHWWSAIRNSPMWSTNLSEGLLEICNSFEASEGEHKIWSLQFCFVVKVRNATLGVKGWTNVNSPVRLLIARRSTNMKPLTMPKHDKTCYHMPNNFQCTKIHQLTAEDPTWWTQLLFLVFLDFPPKEFAANSSCCWALWSPPGFVRDSEECPVVQQRICREKSFLGYERPKEFSGRWAT